MYSAPQESFVSYPGNEYSRPIGDLQPVIRGSIYSDSQQAPRRPEEQGRVLIPRAIRSALFQDIHGSTSEQLGNRASSKWPFLADVFAVQDAGPVSKEQVMRFAINQELTAADEHAARSLVSEHEGHIAQDGHLFINDFDMTQIAEKAVLQNPNDQRLRWELQGISSLAQKMASDGKPRMIVSPSKIAREDGSSYGMVMVFTSSTGKGKDEVQIKEFIVSYEESLGGTEVSSVLANKFGGTKYQSEINNITKQELVANPIDLPVSFKIENLLSELGITDSQREFSKEFKDELYARRKGDLIAYGELLDRSSKLDMRFARNLKRNAQIAGRLKDKVFGYGVVLARAMKTGDFDEINRLDEILKGKPDPNEGDSQNIGQEKVMAYLWHQAKVNMGTQCPTAYFADTSQGVTSVMGSINMQAISGAMHGLSGLRGEGKWQKRACVTCPDCKTESTHNTPHLYNGEKWVCCNNNCKHHDRNTYARVSKSTREVLQ